VTSKKSVWRSRPDASVPVLRWVLLLCRRVGETPGPPKLLDQGTERTISTASNDCPSAFPVHRWGLLLCRHVGDSEGPKTVPIDRTSCPGMMMLETPGLQTVRTERRADSRPDSRGEQGHRLFRAAHRQPRNTHRGRNAQRTHTRQSIAPISTMYSAQKEKPSQSAGRTQEVRLKSALDWRPQEPLAYAAGQKTFWDKGRRTYHLMTMGDARTISLASELRPSSSPSPPPPSRSGPSRPAPRPSGSGSNPRSSCSPGSSRRRPTCPASGPSSRGRASGPRCS